VKYEVLAILLPQSAGLFYLPKGKKQEASPKRQLFYQPTGCRVSEDLNLQEIICLVSVKTQNLQETVLSISQDTEY